MSFKQELQETLLAIIKNKSIEDQASLMHALESQGFSLTQPTLSRYLKKLNITKKNGQYITTNISKELSNNNTQILKSSIAHPNLIIIHTHPGQATYVAFQIDQYVDYPQSERIMHDKSKYIKGLVGTIAGYDTVMVIAEGPEALSQVKKDVEALF